MLLSPRLAPLTLLCFAVTGCFGTPTPLAPYLKGSVGLPHNGVQTSALELPRKGPGYERFRPDGTAYFGQPELVEELQRVAAQLKTTTQAPPMVIGDLSAKHGGKIPRHKSHRSGRDVDLLWYVLTPSGEPRRSPGFLRVGPDGLALDQGTQEFYRLDVERQWLAIKALLESERLQVQWILCSRWIEALLVDHARARGEPDELVWRAETMMLQPKDSLPHDDHIHLRISCVPETMLTGCTGGGPYWPWMPELQVLQLQPHDFEQIGQDDPLLEETPDVREAALPYG